MSTRGLIIFRVDGKDYAQYNHYDMYPKGKGKAIKWRLKVVLEELGGVEEVKARVRRFKELPLFGNESYFKHRGLQGDLEELFRRGVVVGSIDFIKDSNFCKWAYCLNFDDMKLEVYKGFQKEFHEKGRYASQEEDGGCYPCALIVEYPLLNIPETFVEDINRVVYPEEEI
jgi:hypothetical protein